MNYLYNIDVVNAKSGKKLKWWEIGINKLINIIATSLTYITMLMCEFIYVFILYKIIMYVL